MSRKSTRRPTSVTAPPDKPRPRRIAFGAAMIRIILVAMLAVGAAAWALARHFTHPFKSMLVAEPASASGSPEIEVTVDPAPPPAASSR